jgi:hypothetical protein
MEALSATNGTQPSKQLPGFRDLPNVILSPMIKHSGLFFAIVRTLHRLSRVHTQDSD